jgi:hypothetical protein
MNRNVSVIYWFIEGLDCLVIFIEIMERDESSYMLSTTSFK